MTDEQITELLATCSPSRLARIVAPALAAFSESDEFFETRLVLCRFIAENSPVTENLPSWELEWPVAVPPHSEEWTAFEIGGFSEIGVCENCRMEIASYAKEGLCPFCNATVGLT